MEWRDSLSNAFPLGLNLSGGQDPFSRAVSPIGRKFALPHSSGGMELDIPQGGTSLWSQVGDIEMGGQAAVGGVSVVDFACPSTPSNMPQYPPQPLYQAGSTPTSPRSTQYEQRAPSVGHTPSYFPPTLPPQTQTQTPAQAQVQVHQTWSTPDHVRLSKIRRPSLRTLMVHSRPSSPTYSSPLQANYPHYSGSGAESPTLFSGSGIDHEDMPMAMQEDTNLPVQEQAGGIGMGRGPNEGGVGRLRLSIGSEGLGLGLGLEMGHV